MVNQVIIAHKIIDCQNAIGNDILGMYATLRNLGFKAHFLAERVIGLDGFFSNDEEIVKTALSNPDNILIYYYSCKWDYGESCLDNFKGKKIIKVCSFPPPDIFQDGPSYCYEISNRRWNEFDSFIQKHPNYVYWIYSHYEKNILEKKGILNNLFIVYPFIKIPKIENHEINFSIIDSLINNCCNNVLTIGNIIPNRGHNHLIEVIKSYINQFGPNIHLWIIGAMDNIHLKSYYDSLLKKINSNNLQEHISIINSVSAEDLYGYYLGSDEFLCMSEYESTYDPFIEAQIFGLPIVTYEGTSIEEIVGKNQIVLNEFDCDFAASALFTIYTDEKVKRFCRHNGFENVKSRFSPVQIMKEFTSALQQSISDN